MSNYKVGFIGGGNMARALAGGLVSSGYRPEDILIAEPGAERRDELAIELPGVLISADNHEVAAAADCLVLAVKPQMMRAVCLDLAETVKASNPALLLQGASGLFANDATSTEQRDRASDIMSAVGSVVHVPDEDGIDAVTAISGTGPAYFYLLIDMLIRSAEDMGLDAQAAHKLVMDTAKGSAALAAVSGETMEAMIEHVRSPGGTTAAAFAVFDDRNVREIFAAAVAAAKDRAVELAQDSTS
jgi:pyrroline-5-carboxylate reductase